MNCFMNQAPGAGSLARPEQHPGFVDDSYSLIDCSTHASPDKLINSHFMALSIYDEMYGVIKTNEVWVIFHWL